VVRARHHRGVHDGIALVVDENLELVGNGRDPAQVFLIPGDDYRMHRDHLSLNGAGPMPL
jgi:hypothetical protein